MSLLFRLSGVLGAERQPPPSGSRRYVPAPMPACTPSLAVQMPPAAHRMIPGNTVVARPAPERATRGTLRGGAQLEKTAGFAGFGWSRGTVALARPILAGATFNPAASSKHKEKRRHSDQFLMDGRYHSKQSLHAGTEACRSSSTTEGKLMTARPRIGQCTQRRQRPASKISRGLENGPEVYQTKTKNQSKMLSYMNEEANWRRSGTRAPPALDETDRYLATYIIWERLKKQDYSAATVHLTPDVVTGQRLLQQWINRPGQSAASSRAAKRYAPALAAIEAAGSLDQQ
eukprot:GHVT01075259.1.p1 GENE.GHVT01075259.1~~GHVT01075259.1.p1  ORF type:complete len:288 (+),score=37.88 GHVT01075259.1:1496-2359(+)